MRLLASRSLVTIVAFGLVLTAAPAMAGSSDDGYPDAIRINGTTIDLVAYDLSEYEGVELLLLDIGKAQGSDDLAFLDTGSFPAKLRDRIIETVTRESKPEVEETKGTYSTAASRAIAADMLLRNGEEDAPSAYAQAAGWTCGWGYKKVQYRPGLITYYWFSLKTDFCWNGTQVQATPTQSVTGDGSWGWSYEGCTTCTVTGWPSPTAYKSYAKGEMNFGIGPSIIRRPWIQHIVYGAGTVGTTWHD